MAVCLFLLSHSIGYSEEALVPGTTGWTLSYESGDRACFVSAVYERSATVIGFTSDGRSVFLLFANENWNIPENQEYKVRFRFDGRRWHAGTFSSLNTNALGMRLSPRGEAELRRSRDVEIYSDTGNFVGRYSLAGSSRALDYVRKCGIIASGAAANPFGPPSVDPSGVPEANPFR